MFAKRASTCRLRSCVLAAAVPVWVVRKISGGKYCILLYFCRNLYVSEPEDGRACCGDGSEVLEGDRKPDEGGLSCV